MNRRKGVSPIISVVLLLAIMLAIGITFSDFVPNMLQNLTESVSDQTQKTSDTTNYRISIDSAEYNEALDTLDVTVRNSGNRKIDGNISVNAYCESEVFQKNTGNLTVQEIEFVSFSEVKCSVNRVRVALNDYPVSAEYTELKTTGDTSISFGNDQEFSNIVNTLTNAEIYPVRLAKNLGFQHKSSSFGGSKKNITEDSGVLRLAKE